MMRQYDYYMIKYDNITSTMSKYDADMQRISKKFKEYIDYIKII